MKQQCDALTREIQTSIDWTYTNVTREQGQTDALHQLREIRRRSRRLAHAADIRPAIGIFGASQHGKSYLVSNMVRRSEDEPLRVVLPTDGKEVDFERDMNPEGGEESTGAVTRFTIDTRSPSGQPGLQVELLSQTEVAAILTQGYLGNVEVSEHSSSAQDANGPAQTLHHELQRLSAEAGSAKHDGLCEDDIYDLKDHLERHFPNDSRLAELRWLGYWDKAADLAPRLPPDQRGELFAWLWQRHEGLTAIYNKLLSGLEKLEFSRFVATGEDAVVPKRASGEPRTIIDVRVVKGLVNASTLDPLEVTLPSGTKGSVDRAVFTALIKEVQLPIPQSTGDDPNLQFLQHADVLDFPGARQKQHIAHASLEPSHRDYTTNMKELFVRGKVDFLFSAYDTNLRVTTLVIGQKDSTLEVKSVPLLAYDWIARNLGASPDERADKSDRFFVAFTFWNNELEKQAADADAHSEKWTARLESNFREEWQYSRDVDKWIDHWKPPEQPFRNCYFIRDPRFSRAIFSIDPSTGLETNVQPDHNEQLEMMRESFINSPIVQKHVRDPERMWQETATPNKSGTRYLLEGLVAATGPSDKTQQIATQLGRQKTQLLSSLRAMHHDEDVAAEKERAEKNARQLGKAMVRVLKKGMLGLLLERLYVAEAVAWNTYYNIENPVVQAHDAEADRVFSAGASRRGAVTGAAKDLNTSEIFEWGDEGEASPFEWEDEGEASPSEAGSAAGEATLESRLLWNKAELFADELLDHWFAHLTALVDDEGFLATAGMDIEEVRLLINGVKDAARRCRLRDRIRELVEPGFNAGDSSQWIDLYARLATMEINRFVNDLDWSRVQESERPRIRLPRDKSEAAIFSPPALDTPQIEQINLEQTTGTSLFPLYWIQAIYSTVIANAEEVTFDVEANRELGGIIERVDSIQ